MCVAEKSLFKLGKNSRGLGSAILCAGILLCGTSLTGCSDKGSEISSQVAAKVNDREITIHQVNNHLARSGLTGEGAAKDASRKVLESVIDQELLVQQAMDKRLDRDASVMQAMEDAKRRVLSQAYLERWVYSRSVPTAEEVTAYYAQHPELFAKRKIYQLHTFLIGPEKFDEGLKSALDKAKTASNVINILKTRAIDFKEETVQWPAEQMPMELLRTVTQIGIGDIVPLRRDKQLALMQLENAVEQPVDENQAQAAIQKYLINSKNQELLENKLKQLRAAAQISYLGQFTENLADTRGEAAAKEQATISKERAEDFMQKGLSGLKK